MSDFLDIRGASGSVYRFRRMTDPNQVPPEGGNYAYVKQAGDAAKVVEFGMGDTLHQARDGWAEAVRKHGADALYVRLNIASKQRLLEHEDLISAES